MKLQDESKMFQQNNRREFLGSVATGLSATTVFTAGTAESTAQQTSPVGHRIPGHEAIAVPARGGPNEAALITLSDGSVAMFYGFGGLVRM